jgi:hypothetical protein
MTESGGGYRIDYNYDYEQEHDYAEDVETPRS